jgi:hypothetical protein
MASYRLTNSMAMSQLSRGSVSVGVDQFRDHHGRQSPVQAVHAKKLIVGFNLFVH